MDYYKPILQESYITTTLIVLSGILGLIYSGIQFLKIRRIPIFTQLEGYNTLELDLNNNKMNKVREVYSAIKEGADAFLWSEYKYMFVFIIVYNFSKCICVVYKFI